MMNKTFMRYNIYSWFILKILYNLNISHEQIYEILNLNYEYIFTNIELLKCAYNYGNICIIRKILWSCNVNILVLLLIISKIVIHEYYLKYMNILK